MDDILKKVEFLFEKYSLERRATTQPYLLRVIEETVPGYVYKPEAALARETLMEHVGSTPILATVLYPYIEDAEVNLGDALTMLAIHDIGELVTGDENTFTKKADAKNAEFEAGLTLLDPIYHDLYRDAEEKGSKTAQFAKAIDKIAPDIMDYLTPANITIERYQHFVGIEAHEIIDLITEKKRPYMLWNPFMTEFHIHLMEKFKEKLG